MFKAHALDGTELKKSTQLHDAFSVRLYFVFIGRSKTRTVSAQLVLKTYIPMRPFTLEFSSVQFSLSAVNEP